MWFEKGFVEGGGKILGKDRTPLAAMEYGPFLQRAIEGKPEKAGAKGKAKVKENA